MSDAPNYQRLAVAILQERETIRLIRLLEGAGIDVLVFKGQVLSVEAYGEIGQRDAGDIDLLVRPEDKARAAEILLADGFRFHFDLSPREWELVLANESAWALLKGRITVDLHWQLFSRTTAFDLPTTDAFADARTVDLGGNPVPTLSHQHLVLFLAIHGAKHLWERQEWITSFAKLASRPETDWPAIERLAARLHGKKRLAEARALIRNQASAPPPAPQNRFTSLAAHARQFDRKRDALRAAAIAIFQPKLPDWRWLELPRWLEWLYPLVRMLRLLARAIT